MQFFEGLQSLGRRGGRRNREHENGRFIARGTYGHTVIPRGCGQRGDRARGEHEGARFRQIKAGVKGQTVGSNRRIFSIARGRGSRHTGSADVAALSQVLA